MKIADIFFIDKIFFLELTVPFMLSEHTHAFAISDQTNKYVLKNRRNVVVNNIKSLKVFVGMLISVNKN